MFKLNIFKNTSIAKKILFWSLMVSLVPIHIAGYVNFKKAESVIKKHVLDNLTTIAESRELMFNSYISEKERDVGALARTPTIIDALEKYHLVFHKSGIGSPEYKALDKELRSFLAYYKNAFGYHDLFFICNEGNVTFTVQREDDFGTNLYTGHYKDTELAKAFKKVATLHDISISNFKYYFPSNEPAAFIGAPVFKGENFIGVVAFQLKNTEVNEQIQDYSGLGKTGETVIASKEGNEAVFIFPLRHDLKAAFNRRVALGSKEALPIQEAVQGRKGSGISIDYRNKEVLAVWRYLPHLRWGMVTKIDAEEAFVSIYKLRYWTLVTGTIFIFGIIILAFRISRSISAPIKALHKGSEIIGSGKLDYKVGTDAKDEIGQLSRTFDQMIENLKTVTASRNELNKEITERKRAEEEMRESEEKFSNIFHHSNDGIFLHDSNGRIIDVNQKVLDQFGYIKSEILALKIPDLHPLEMLEKSKYAFEKISQDGFVNFEIDFKKKNGEVFPAEVSSSLFEIAGEKVIQGVVRDITERKRSQERDQLQLKRINALHSIERAITASLDLHVTFDILLIQVTTKLKVDAASILLLNQNTQILEYVSSKGFRTSALKYTKLKLGESNAGRAALERRIVTIPNLKKEIDGFASSKLFTGEDFVTYFGVPLIAKGQIKGVLELFHRATLSTDPEWLEFLETIADQAAMAIDNASLFDGLQRSNIELILAYDTTIEGWSRAMDLRDKETEGHTQRVAEMTIRIAHELGIKEEEIVHMRRGALLHDIGKMGIPDSILLKPERLTKKEWEMMKRHSEYAYDMLYRIEYLRPALDIPHYHHEKWDGTGYPRGLKGEEIPLAARIFAVTDVWDALCSDRPYRPAWSKKKVREHIHSLAGIHFDPKVAEVFLKMKW